MLGGGLLQLVATGRQDIYLSGNPQTTFFKQVYRRHTNFAMESCRIDFDGAADFGKVIVATLPRKGDLINSLILEISLPALPQTSDLGDTSWTNGIGHAMIDYISLEIGGKEIDRQYGEYLHVYSQLQVDASKRTGYNNMIGYQEAYTQTSQPGPLKLYVPLRFWFCNNIGLSLPLIALQAHPVRLYVKMRPVNSLFYRDSLVLVPTQTLQPTPHIDSLVMWGDYIHLDTEERRRFTSSKHEYLIEQVQIQKKTSIPAGATLSNVTLDFNNPIKELLWVVQQDRMLLTNELFNYTNRQLTEQHVTLADQISTCILRLDGYDRFEVRDASYFRLVQPWQRHTSVPDDYIYVYSFSLAPEAAQPMGSMNASRIDTIILSVTMNNNTVRYDSGITVYATNYNVLRIAAGLGGVLFTA
jgi:Major capsid protein N-terminus/Large eukaryotic DNA virus major capsid protein